MALLEKSADKKTALYPLNFNNYNYLFRITESNSARHFFMLIKE